MFKSTRYPGDRDGRDEGVTSRSYVYDQDRYWRRNNWDGNAKPHAATRLHVRVEACEVPSYASDATLDTDDYWPLANKSVRSLAGMQ